MDEVEAIIVYVAHRKLFFGYLCAKDLYSRIFSIKLSPDRPSFVEIDGKEFSVDEVFSLQSIAPLVKNCPDVT